MRTKRKTKYLNVNMKKIANLKLLFFIFSLTLCLYGSVALFSTSAQTESPFQVGERLTYNISFAKFENAAYAEIYVVSKGKLQGKDAVELSSKLKSDGLVSAAFYLLDESRSTFVSPDNGLPFYVRNVSRAGGLPKDRIDNFLKAPTTNYDLLSLIYKVRHSGGAGTFSVQENEKIYSFDFASTGGEIVKTDVGEFETTVSTVQSEYLTELGLTDFRVNFTNGEKKIPVLIRFKTPKGDFSAKIASIQNLEPVKTPEPSTSKTPKVVVKKTPKPISTPKPYINNQRLAEDIPFELGETLEFQVSKGKTNFGKVVLQAKERKQVNRIDSLILKAFVTDIGNGKLFSINDTVETRVEPYTLTPIYSQINLKKKFSIFNQIASFDQELGMVNFNANKKVSIPVGTHSILSLAYAIRSFNLKPSLNPKNPVNDTRVAVLLGNKAFVLTLRPQIAKIITLNGEKVSAQLVSIRTGNRSIDRLNLRLWLSNDSKRVPLRFAIGSYQADLISEKVISPKKS